MVLSTAVLANQLSQPDSQHVGMQPSKQIAPEVLDGWDYKCTDKGGVNYSWIWKNAQINDNPTVHDAHTQYDMKIVSETKRLVHINLDNVFKKVPKLKKLLDMKIFKHSISLDCQLQKRLSNGIVTPLRCTDTKTGIMVWTFYGTSYTQATLGGLSGSPFGGRIKLSYGTCVAN